MSEFWINVLAAVAAGLILAALGCAIKKLWSHIARWWHKKRHPPAISVISDNDLDNDRPRYF